MKTSSRLFLLYAIGALILAVTVVWYGWEAKRSVEKSLAIEVQTLGGQLGHYLADLSIIEAALDTPRQNRKNLIQRKALLAQETAEARTQNFLRIADAYPSIDMGAVKIMDEVLAQTAMVIRETKALSEKEEATLLRQLGMAVRGIRGLLTRVNARGVDMIAVQAEQLKNFQIVMAIYLGLFTVATLIIVAMIAKGRQRAEKAQANLEKTVEERTRALAEKSDLLETTLRSVDQGITVLDNDLNVILVNERFCELADFPLSFKDGTRHFEDFMRYNAKRGEYGSRDVEAIVAEKIDQAKQFEPYKIERTRPNGTILEIVGRTMPGGGMVTTFTDVTNRIQMHREAEHAREAAEKASAAKSDFLANMSHELRTPLNGIMGFAQLLLMPRDNSLTPRDREYVEIILKAGDHLLELINDILDLAKIESGNIVLASEKVSLSDILKQSFDLVSPIAAKNNISLSIEDGGEWGSAMAYADPIRLKQCVVNLLSNGVKYNTAGGTVAVSCKMQASGKMRINVADTGFGIPDNQIEELFSPFVRLNQKDNAIEGTGVGLALTKTLVELMGGEVGVVSSEGKGSCFWIDIPLAEYEKEE